MPAPRLSPLVAASTLAVLAHLPLPAQLLSAAVSPNPAPPGAPVTLAVTDAHGLGLFTPSTCLVTSVTAGGPRGVGTAVWTAGPCGDQIVFVPACGGGPPLSATWAQLDDAQQPVPAGTYWLNVDVVVPGLGLHREALTVTVVASPSQPTLTLVVPPGSGGVTVQSIASPADPGAAYLLAAAGSTNLGFGLGPGRFALDRDPILAWSLAPSAGLVNFQGQLDASGTSPLSTVYLPIAPALSCLPLHLQAVILPSGGAPPRPTNCLHLVLP